MRKKIIVTEKDLHEGIAKDCTCCPTVLALERELPLTEGHFWRVFRDRVSISQSSPYREIPLSDRAVRGISKIDHQNGETFNFILTVPDWAVKYLAELPE